MNTRLMKKSMRASLMAALLPRHDRRMMTAAASGVASFRFACLEGSLIHQQSTLPKVRNYNYVRTNPEAGVEPTKD